MLKGCTFPRCECRGFCRLARSVSDPPVYASWKPRRRPNPSACGIKPKHLMQADGSACPYCREIMRCGDPYLEPTRDHIVPWSRGGPHTISNVRIVCARCNQDKGTLSLRSWCRLLQNDSDPRARYVAFAVAEYDRQRESAA